MIDRGKVLKGLECCTWSDAGLYEGYAVESSMCEICPYHDEKKQMGECNEDLRVDALELLKAQEPRVLTLEEVQNDCPDYVYIEIASGRIKCCVKDEGESSKYFGYFVYGFNECFIRGWKEYGKTWRCWTAMPTDKQRKAVKWDD